MSQKYGRTSCHERRNAEPTERSSMVITGPTSDHKREDDHARDHEQGQASERRNRQHHVGRHEPAQREHPPNLAER